MEAARGHLVHAAAVARETVRDYRILAAAEGNFHPQGAVARALAGLDGSDDNALRRRAALLIEAVDPLHGVSAEGAAMHEMSLCESLIGVIEDQAAVHDYRRVNRVRLEVGTLACVEPEALRFCFDLVTRGTLAAGAELQIIEMKPEARCLACSQAVAVLQRFDACPECGSHRLQISGGDQLRIKELEVD